jgi:hypothetical protein
MEKTYHSSASRADFPNFIRVNPSNALVVTSAMQMIRRIGWRRIGVIGTFRTRQP